MNSGKRPCRMRLKPANSVFARWFSRNCPREAPPVRAFLNNWNCWPSPMRTSRPSRHTWPGVFIGNTAAKGDRVSILSRISWSLRTPSCNAIVWPRSIVVISGATSRACVFCHPSRCGPRRQFPKKSSALASCTHLPSVAGSALRCLAFCSNFPTFSLFTCARLVS